MGPLLRREFKVLWRDRSAVVNPLSFLFLVVMLFAVGSELTEASAVQYAGGLIWLLVLLTNLVSLDALFRRDFDSGVLEQVLVAGDSAFWVILLNYCPVECYRVAVGNTGTHTLCVAGGADECTQNCDAFAIIGHTSD